jgi:hypothetical protein
MTTPTIAEYLKYSNLQMGSEEPKGSETFRFLNN